MSSALAAAPFLSLLLILLLKEKPNTLTTVAFISIVVSLLCRVLFKIGQTAVHSYSLLHRCYGKYCLKLVIVLFCSQIDSYCVWLVRWLWDEIQRWEGGNARALQLCLLRHLQRSGQTGNRQCRFSSRRHIRS